MHSLPTLPAHLGSDSSVHVAEQNMKRGELTRRSWDLGVCGGP